MAGTIIPWFRQQFFDANGDPLASGTLETYETGTSTPLATYSDAGLTVTNGTTITLNAGGYPTVTGVEVAIFLLPRAYRFVLKNSAGSTVRTLDGVYAYQAASATNLEVDGVAGVAIAATELCYLSDGSGGLTAGRWYLADADLYYGSIHPELAFASAAIAVGATGTFRRAGIMDGLSGLVAGSTYYVSGTAGLLTATAPMNARSVGVASSATVLNIDIGPAWLANGDPLSICDGRLTLTTALPVTTADVTAAGTIYFAPYGGNRIALFDGSKWKVYPFTQLSLALTATSGFNYDVWVYDNAGTLTLETLIWSSDTARGTALTTQDGVIVKTGVTTRRYLGTFRASASNVSEDSFANRFVWNYYHRVLRPMRVMEATDSWTYGTTTLRQARASAANQLAFVVGVAEVLLAVDVVVTAAADTAGDELNVGIGLDATNALATGCLTGKITVAVAGYKQNVVAQLRTYPAAGYHFAAWLEFSEATGTFFGDGGATTGPQSGIHGWMEM